MKPLELNAIGLKTLDQVRYCSARCQLGDASQDAATRLLWLVSDEVVMREPSARARLETYRWAVRELGESLRLRAGSDLAFHLELTMRRWVDLGLDWDFLQTLVAALWQRFGPDGAGIAAAPEAPRLTGSAQAGLPVEEDWLVVNAT